MRKKKNCMNCELFDLDDNNCNDVEWNSYKEIFIDTFITAQCKNWEKKK